MKPKKLLLATLLSLAILPIRADVLELKNGQTLNGKYVGGTAGTIRFETGGGMQVIETGAALALTFTGGGAATTAPAAAAPAPGAAAPTPPVASSVTIPGGTILLVRMVDSVSSKDPQGKRFTASLDADLTVNGVVAARTGTKVYGRVQSAQQARRFAGQSKFELQLTELAVGPNLVPLLTSGYTDAGARSGGKTVKGAAVGAGIGAIADGGDGAAKGAAIGALASGLKKGESLAINSGTLLEFRLQQPVTVNVAP